jgi:hypothetical protein
MSLGCLNVISKFTDIEVLGDLAINEIKGAGSIIKCYGRTRAGVSQIVRKDDLHREAARRVAHMRCTMNLIKPSTGSQRTHKINPLPTRAFEPGKKALCQELGSATARCPFAAPSTLRIRASILENLVFSILIA